MGLAWLQGRDRFFYVNGIPDVGAVEPMAIQSWTSLIGQVEGECQSLRREFANQLNLLQLQERRRWGGGDYPPGSGRR